MADFLLVRLHGSALRLLSREAGMHFEGLASAGRFFCRAGRLGSRHSRRLRQLDDVCAWLRHATECKCDDFMDDLAAVLSLSKDGAKDEVVQAFKKDAKDQAVRSLSKDGAKVMARQAPSVEGAKG